jgi:hypothetical protein
MIFVGLATAVVSVLVAWPFVDVSLGGDHYVYLAHHFVRGDLSVDGLSARYGDVVRWNGHVYLPFGPLPALLLVPFLPLIDSGMPLVIVGYVFTILNVFLFYRVLGSAGVDDDRRRWMTLVFFAGTPYLGVLLVGISTYFAQIVATTFLLLAMLELGGKGRGARIGVLLGAAGASRMTAIFTLPYFVYTGYRERPSRMRWLMVTAAGLAIPMAILAFYNYARFGNPSETGFGMALLYDRALYAARDAGLFSLVHVPKNLFMMLLKGPDAVGGDAAAITRFPFIQPSRWGMGLFFTSPALIYAFMADRKDPRVRALWLGVISTVIPIVCYYGIGFVQFGYRYALDFMPLLALLAALGMPKPMTSVARFLAAASVIVSLWGAIYLAVWI